MKKPLEYMHRFTAAGAVLTWIFFIAYSIFPSDPVAVTIESGDCESVYEVAPDTVKTVEASSGSTEKRPSAAVAQAKPVASPPSAAVNVNRAGLDELITLSGIGPVIAERIIAYRDSVGPFQSVPDLMKVKGLGEKKCAAIAGRVTF